MADQEQVERLLRGVKEWNEWRQEHYDIQPDLSNADLKNAELISVNLSNANLSNANLIDTNINSADLSGAKLFGTRLTLAYLGGAKLSYAKLNGAILSSADLGHADLSGADLSGADLISADLRHADLKHAILKGAILSSAIFGFTNLNGASFSRTRFWQTLFASVDLSQVKDLDTATHDGPSSVDINSVILPHDEPTRLHFLRGVGFTETQIEYLPSLLTPRPIQYSSLFISYAHQDEAIAKRLYNDLRKKDVPCWFAPHDLRPGTPILRGLEEAIHLQDKFLLVLSRDAVNSRWIEREVDVALHQEIKRGQDVLFPIRLDNAVLESSAGWATRLQHRHIGDFTDWQDDTAYQQAFSTLLGHLKVNTPSSVKLTKRYNVPYIHRR